MQTAEKPLSGYERWMVSSNLETIKGGKDAAEIINTLKANGYHRVAAAVEAASK